MGRRRETTKDPQELAILNLAKGNGSARGRAAAQRNGAGSGAHNPQPRRLRTRAAQKRQALDHEHHSGQRFSSLPALILVTQHSQILDNI